MAAGFDFEGDETLRAAIETELHEVVDPEMALDVLELGLVYRVKATRSEAHAAITMTTPACPVTELIAEDVEAALRRAVGEDARVSVEVVWDPPWEPGRMTENARKAMGW